MKKNKIAIIGLGYVGLPLARLFATKYSVVGFDINSDRISELMLDKKALDIKIIDVIGLTSLTDYFINCSSQSDPQTRAIKNHIQDELSKEFQINKYRGKKIQNRKRTFVSFNGH